MTTEHYEIYPAPKPFKVPRKLKIIVAVMVVCALAGLAGLASASKTTKAASGQPVYAGYAQLVAENYVSGHKLNVPVASSLDNQLGRTTQQAGAASTATTPNQNLSNTVEPLNVSYLTFVYGSDSTNSKTGLITETDTFLIEASSGDVSHLVVVMSGNGKTQPTLGAAPTLFPGDPTKSGGAVVTGVTTQSTQTPLPKNVISQVDVWGNAFTGSNHRGNQDLYNLTGDTTNRQYQGLTGYTLIGNPLIISATPYDAAKPPKTVEMTVQLTLQSNSDPTVVTTSEYDLLVDNLQNAEPNIAAWGPPGSGPSLVPFQNGF